MALSMSYLLLCRKGKDKETRLACLGAAVWDMLIAELCLSGLGQCSPKISSQPSWSSGHPIFLPSAVSLLLLWDAADE